MTSTTMMKTDKAFDDFLKGISFADFDVAYTDNTVCAEDTGLCDNDLVADDTARVVFAGPIKVVEPVASPTSVDPPIHLPMRKVTTKPSGRASATAQRRRDRRRNQVQRERENEKRKIKQMDFVQMRRDCFEGEHKLRGSICAIITDITRTQGVSVEEAIAPLPQEVRAVLARSKAAMQRYRTFTGQKHICEQLNRFPSWSEDY